MWTMPAEWEPHERTWMAWPPTGPTTADLDEEGVHSVRAAWAAVANAVVRFEPLTMVIEPSDVNHARALLDDRIDIIQAPLNDAWMRDIGPTFVLDAQGQVSAVDWVFNGWGAQSWAEWDKDCGIARRIAQQADTAIISSAMVNEGGGIHVDGRGTALVTETVQLDPGRNPGLTKPDVEAELARTLGVSRVVWLARGLTRDYEAFGTRGHVDIVAAFAGPDTILYHDQRNAAHPDFQVSAQVKSRLESAGPWRLVPVPAPDALRDEEGWVDYSYINHYVLNGAVILCAFDDPGDERAKQILASAYPDREIVLVDARVIFSRGGGIHCITQQQPRTTQQCS
ncbi:MAG: agmatine deiminase family protein [Actinomycetes bacterium]